MSSSPPSDAAGRLLSLIAGKWVAQAVATAATLGISDVLGEEALTVDELATRLNCHPGTLERLMLVLAAEGVYEVSGIEEKYRVTEVGRLLAEGDVHYKDLASFIGSSAQWAPWSSLPECIRSGKSAFEATHGVPLYQWLEENPEDARLYDEGIEGFTAAVARRLPEVFDFSETQLVVDIGGGLGTALASILERWPHVRGVLVDRPYVLKRTQARLELKGLADRCELVSGSFFDKLPDGGDVYLVKHVLHNWKDEDAIQILSRCREAIVPEGQLLVVEGILHPGPGQNAARLMDLEMMVLFGQGRERTKREFKELFGRAGFRLDRTTLPLDDFARLLLGRPSDVRSPV